LTQVELDALRPADAGIRLRDGDGVVGIVHAGKDGSVSVRFSLRYKVEGRVREVRLGTWPKKVSLAEMRRERDRVRNEVRQRIDPAQRRLAHRLEDQAKIVENERLLAEEAARIEAERIENKPLLDLFDDWVKNGTARKDGGAEIRRTFEKDVLPTLGSTPVRSVTDDDLRAVLRAVGQERGRGRLAVLLFRDLRQMFRWGSKAKSWRRLLAEGDPTASIKVENFVDPDYDLSNMRQRRLSHKEIRELRDIFRKMEADYANAPDRRKAVRPVARETQLALWLCLATCCRIGELLSAEWEHVDLEKGEWIIPRSNYKRVRGDKRPDFLVCLSPFAIRHFKALRDLTDDSRWCFPARHKKDDEHVCLKSISKQVGDRQTKFKNRTKPLKGRRNDDSLVLNKGKSGEWTPHDLRRTGSTMMSELKVIGLVRNLCLNHSIGTKIDQTYDLHDFADEKREAWQLLGDRLEAILAENVVILPERGAA
jgi:integrase